MIKVPEPVLTDGDRQGPTWMRLKKHYEERLATLRTQNDAALAAEKTAELRGQIKEVKRLLKLDSDTPDFEVPATK